MPFACYICDNPFGANDTIQVSYFTCACQGREQGKVTFASRRSHLQIEAGGWGLVPRAIQGMYFSEIPEEDYQKAYMVKKTRKEIGQRQCKWKVQELVEKSSSESEDEEEPKKLKSAEAEVQPATEGELAVSVQNKGIQAELWILRPCLT